MRHGIRRLLLYSVIGISTFGLDLAILYLLTDVFGWHYVLSAGIAFLVAVSINYALSRKVVFRGTERSAHHGYAIYLGITAVGLGAVMGLMALLVGALGWHYLSSRVIVAGAVGIWNYLMNLYVNFRVAGKHVEQLTPSSNP